MNQAQEIKDKLFVDSIGTARIEQVCDAALEYVKARDRYGNTVFATRFKPRPLCCRIRYVGRYYGDYFHHRLFVRLHRPGIGLVAKLCKPLCCFTEIDCEAHKLYEALGSEMDLLISDFRAATQQIKWQIERAAKASIET